MVAGDLLAAMDELGHSTFAVVGHDRGSYVAFRMALDAPEVVTRAALLDCIPIVEHLERITTEFATQRRHWFFFAQPEVPERVISADPDGWYRGDPTVMGEQNDAEWRAATRDPRVVRAMLEDYRAGLGIDAQDERADRAAGRRLRMPTLVAWSEHDDLGLGVHRVEDGVVVGERTLAQDPQGDPRRAGGDPAERRHRPRGAATGAIVHR